MDWLDDAVCVLKDSRQVRPSVSRPRTDTATDRNEGERLGGIKGGEKTEKLEQVVQ